MVPGEIVQPLLALELGFYEGVPKLRPLLGVDADAAVHHPQDGEEEALLKGEVVSEGEFHVQAFPSRI